MPFYVVDFYRGFVQKGGAAKMFQSKRKGVFVLCNLRYLSSSWLGKFVGKVVDGVWPVTEGVDGSDRISGNDKEVSDEMSMWSFTKFVSSWENVCVIQGGYFCDEVGGLKDFSQICSKVGIEPK